MRARIRPAPLALLALLALLASIASACSPPAPVGDDGSASNNDVTYDYDGHYDVWVQPTCRLGQQQPCTCAGGLQGQQVCGPDASYGACMCVDGGPADARTCDPGSQVPCACVGGAPGVQTCDSSGSSYGACDCGGG